MTMQTTFDTGSYSELEAAVFGILQQFDISLCDDIRFLTAMALAADTRLARWQGRTLTGLRLALGMNKLGGRPVDPAQLTVAWLGHDIAMGFLPLSVLQKEARPTKAEFKLIATHVRTAADLINRLQGWQPARDMILCHHERADGTGYPGGFEDEESVDGARIIAIVDAFINQSGNAMHGVMEINRFSEQQFSAPWVRVFNAAVKQFG